MKYSHHYSKLDRTMYTTIRRYKKGNEGDIVPETYPDGSHHSKIVLEFQKSLNEMSTTFLLQDTDCKTREEAIKLLNSFYQKPIGLDEKLFVYILQKVNENRELSVSRKLWELNKTCPKCGSPIKNHDIQASETGFSYCSNECAKKHVNENYNEEVI